MKKQKRKDKVRPFSVADESRIQAGIASDPDNPEWTAQDFRRAKPFAKAFPALAESRRGRGPQKLPTKVAVSLRLTREVVERFKAAGPGWQSRMDKANDHVHTIPNEKRGYRPGRKSQERQMKPGRRLKP